MGPTHVCVQQPFSERQGLKCQPLVWKRVHSKGVVQVAMLADLWGASRTDCHRSTIPVVWGGAWAPTGQQCSSGGGSWVTALSSAQHPGIPLRKGTET